jgi:DNA polymerase III sliding clamp (beta) subunit (PCNA family)
LTKLCNQYSKAALAREFGISLPTLRQILRGHHPHPAIAEKVQREITFTRAGDSLSVAIGGTSLTVQLGTGTFPPYEHLIPSESVAVEGISFNPAYMADFAKVPCSNMAGTMLTMEFSGERKPIKVTIPHDSIKWAALLMPMRKA